MFWILHESTPFKKCCHLPTSTVLITLCVHCLTLNPIQFWELSTQEDFALGMAGEDGSLAKLNNDALRICIIGRRRIQEAVRLYTLSWLMKDTKISMHCANEGTCSGHKDDLIKSSFRSSTNLVWVALAKWKVEAHSLLCTSCSKEVQRLNQAGREKTWELLPSFFGLPPWDELKNLE